MPKRSISSISAVTNPSPLLFALTTENRLEQDKHLQPLMDLFWCSEWFLSLRRELNEQHASFRRAIEANVEQGILLYIEHITDMVMPADEMIVPVDVWPWIPPRYTDERKDYYEGFREVLDGVRMVLRGIRDDIGLFTPGRWRLNRHYDLLLAHLLLWPDNLKRASQIPDPYPWPFILRLDKENAAHLERQRDITTSLQLAADRVERALFEGEKQAPPLARRASRKTLQKRDQRKDDRLRLGDIGYHLNSGRFPIKYEAILEHSKFIEAQKAMKTKITSTGALSTAIHAYCKANNLPLPEQGRPSTQS